MRLLREWGWFGAMGAGLAVVLVCCAVGPAVVAGAVSGIGAGLVSGRGLVGLLTALGVALAVAVFARRRARSAVADASTAGESDGIVGP
jgi:hypothetical protein